MLERLRIFSTVVIFALALWAPARALAVDGVIEINQVKALAGGVTTGDVAGFPVEIEAPGSYRLTSNLAATADRSGISITAPNVTLDLNGFTIRSLGGASLVSGITITGAATTNTEIRHGTVRDFTGNGVAQINFAGVQSTRIIGVRALANGLTGLSGGEGSRIEGCTAVENGDDGIAVLNGSFVLHSVARSNGGDGIHGGGPSSGYFGNVLSENNGGNANPQVLSVTNLGQNLCGTALCP